MKKLFLLLIILMGLTESQAQGKYLNSIRVNQVCPLCCSYATTVMFFKSKGITLPPTDCYNYCTPPPNTTIEPCNNCSSNSMEDIQKLLLGNYNTTIKSNVSWPDLQKSINKKNLSYLSIGYKKTANSKPFHVMAVKGYESINNNYKFILVNDPYCYSTLRMTKIRYDGVTDIKAEFPSEFLIELPPPTQQYVLTKKPTTLVTNEINFNISFNNTSNYDISPVYVTYIKDNTISNTQDTVYDVNKKNFTNLVTRMQLVKNNSTRYYTPLAIFEVNKPVKFPLLLDDANLLAIEINSNPNNLKYYLSNVPVAGVESGRVIPYKKVIFPPSYNEYLYFKYNKKGYYYSLADLNEDIRFGKVYEEKSFLNKLWGFYKQLF